MYYVINYNILNSTILQNMHVHINTRSVLSSYASRFNHKRGQLHFKGSKNSLFKCKGQRKWSWKMIFGAEIFTNVEFPGEKVKILGVLHVCLCAYQAVAPCRSFSASWIASSRIWSGRTSGRPAQTGTNWTCFIGTG